MLITTTWISIAQTSQAQQHYNVWFRSTLSVPVGKKFKIDNEFQHRWQNGFDNTNVLDKNLMSTFRNWAHYQHYEDVKFSLSPFAYLSNYKLELQAVGNVIGKAVQLPQTDSTGKVGGTLYTTFIDLTEMKFVLVYKLDNSKIQKLDLLKELQTGKKRKINLE